MIGIGHTPRFSLFAGDVPKLNISYKPQKISPKSQNTVRQLLHERIRDAYVHPQFVADVMRPLKIEDIIDQEVQNLSGGELQRVALALCLGKPADVYLIDEPSAYLDSEQRLVAAKVRKLSLICDLQNRRTKHFFCVFTDSQIIYELQKCVLSMTFNFLVFEATVGRSRNDVFSLLFLLSDCILYFHSSWRCLTRYTLNSRPISR